MLQLLTQVELASFTKVFMLQVGSMSSALPICMEADSNFLDVLQDLQGSLPWLSLTPHCTNQSTPFMQSVVVRGIPETTPRR